MPTEPKKKVEEQDAVKRAPRKRATPKKEVGDEAVVAEAAEVSAAESAKGGSFIATVGRRKTSIARVRVIKNGKGTITVNGKTLEKYFGTHELREQAASPLKAVGQETALDVSVKVNGGGILGQAQAIRMGIARGLLELNPMYRASLKKLGFLTRDSRKRERKKFGHKSARRSPQWSKR